MAAPMMELYSWGANSYGQLANGTTDDLFQPHIIDKLQLNLDNMTGGGGHTLLLTAEKSMYASGWNAVGQLGISSTSSNASKCLYSPVAVTAFPADAPIVSVAAGWDFTLALSIDGLLYSWGSNSFGQLGISAATKRSHDAHLVVLDPGKPSKIVSVAAGLRHASAIDESGRLFTWGSGRKGQLGRSDLGNPRTMIPVEVKVPFDSNDQLMSVVCGAYHTGCLTKQGMVYVWGDNKHGQTTVPPSISTSVPLPQMIPQEYFNERPVVKLRSGWTHFIAETSDGSLYTWGRNDYCQLGRLTDQSTFDNMPRVIEGLKNPRDFCCGSEHNLLLSNTGDLFSWGWNEHGICGTGDEINVPLPRPVEQFRGSNIVKIACGAGHSMVLTSNEAK